MTGKGERPGPTDGDDETTIAIDVYGIKAKSSASSLGEDPPTSWQQVLDQVRGHLYRIAAGVTRLVAEALEGATRIVRGLSRLPTSFAIKLERSHELADGRENQRQHAMLNRATAEHSQNSSDMTSQVTATASALARIQAILDRYQKEGTEAYLVISSTGKIVVVVGTPPTGEGPLLKILEGADAMNEVVAKESPLE